MADEKDFVYGNYVAKTRENNAVKIDDTWYSVQEKIQGFLKNFKKGDKVRFKVDEKGKKKVIFLLYKVEGEEAKTEAVAPTTEPKPDTSGGTGGGKPNQAYWDKRNASIIRQSYARTAAFAIPALGNVADTEALTQMIITIAEGLIDWEEKKAKE